MKCLDKVREIFTIRKAKRRPNHAGLNSKRTMRGVALTEVIVGMSIFMIASVGMVNGFMASARTHVFQKTQVDALATTQVALRQVLETPADHSGATIDPGFPTSLTVSGAEVCSGSQLVAKKEWRYDCSNTSTLFKRVDIQIADPIEVSTSPALSIAMVTIHVVFDSIDGSEERDVELKRYKRL